MNILLWVVQAILAGSLVWAGSMKLFQDASKLASMWPWTGEHATLTKMTGVLDILAAIGLVLVWRTFLAVGFFSALFSWFQYQFQIVSLGDLAVYMDGMTITPQTVAANMKSIQLNAIISANKKIFGYVIIAGFGVMLYVITHHFGKRTEYLRVIRILKGKSVIARRRARERVKLEEDIKGAAGPAL